MSRNQNADTIAKLNDMLRDTFLTGRVVMTEGVAALPVEQRHEVLRQVRTFSDFNEDNDPWGEHDFGRFEVEGQWFNWKIDYFDKALERHSPDPSDEKVTMRVLTIMLAEEY